MMMASSSSFDCIIIGGSYGGLSAALALGRSLRNVVVIDEGLPCNRFALHSHNFLTHDGTVPSEIAATGRQQIQEKYKTVSFLQDRVVNITPQEQEEQHGASSGVSFQVSTASGQLMYNAKRVIFATGLQDQIPDHIPGFTECWGISVVHCPYCHGYEHKQEPTGLMITSPVALHLVPMVRNLTKQLTILTHGAELTEGQRADYARNGITVVDTPVKELHHDQGHLRQVELQDGTVLSFHVLYASLPFELNAKSLLIDCLGCETDPVGGFVKVNGMQKTSVDGILACGDCTTPMRTVTNAVHGGNLAGIVVNNELSAIEFANRNQT